MMAPLDSPEGRRCSADGGASLPSPAPPPLSPPPPPPTSDASAKRPAERDMVFFRRPDLSARQLFFQNGGAGVRRRAESASNAESAVPVQLVGVDGRAQIGMPVTAASARPFTEVAVGPQDPRRAPRDSRLSRLVVTSDALSDPSTKRRLGHIQRVFILAALANIILTVSLMFPSDESAWFYVDGFDSAVGPVHLQRVQATRPAILILTLTSNAVGVVAASIQKEGLLTIYIFGTVVSDVWTLTMLLPHAFFLLRLLFDVLLVLLAAEARSYLTQQWFVTNFHRLRF